LTPVFEVVSAPFQLSKGFGGYLAQDAWAKGAIPTAALEKVGLSSLGKGTLQQARSILNLGTASGVSLGENLVAMTAIQKASLPVARGAIDLLYGNLAGDSVKNETASTFATIAGFASVFHGMSGQKGFDSRVKSVVENGSHYRVEAWESGYANNLLRRSEVNGDKLSLRVTRDSGWSFVDKMDSKSLQTFELYNRDLVTKNVEQRATLNSFLDGYKSEISRREQGVAALDRVIPQQEAKVHIPPFHRI
jgi:hypothetical protein